MKFQGSQNYVATQDLMLAVNAAITLKRPLLVKGEPGTGKTMLAEEVAQALDMPLLQWHIKSTTKAQQGLYEYDAVSRLRDSQLGDEKVKDIHNYIVKGVLWQAFTADQPVALLIDEIDKADIEFPNDLLRELDRMEFYVYETRELVKARHRPLVFITSNNEKELPDAFLRRCFFHYIKFPDADTMKQIVDVHFPGPEEGTADRGDEDLLRRAQPARPEEEAQHLRAARLAEAAGGRGHPGRGAAKQGRQGRRAAAGGRPAEERTGRDAVREARLHAAAQPLILVPVPGGTMNKLLLEGPDRRRRLPRSAPCSASRHRPAARLGHRSRPVGYPPQQIGGIAAVPAWRRRRRAAGAPLARARAARTSDAKAGTRHAVRPAQVRLEPITRRPRRGPGSAARDGELWNLRVTSVPAPGEAAAYVAARSRARKTATCCPSWWSTRPAAA
jgi:MoxR-like ATPase